MPKLPTENIHVRTEADGGIKVPCRAHVTTEGMFFMEIPDPYFPTFQSFANSLPGGVYQETEDHKKVDFNGIRLYSMIPERLAFKQGAASTDYQQLIAFFKLAVAFHYKAIKVEEKVLIYQYDSGFKYWKNPDGKLFANGNAKGADTERGEWAGNDRVHATHREKTGLTLRCYCLNKTTHTRGKSVVTEFERYYDEQGKETFGGLINFLSPGECPRAEKFDNGELRGWTMMPYTEQAAEFFYKTLHGLCRIDDSLRTFFGSEERVVQAIASGQLPLLK